MIKADLLGTVAAQALIGVGGGPPLSYNPNAADPHRYWRLKGTVAGSFDGGALGEVEFYSLTGGDLTSVGGTPSAGSEAFGGTAAAAFDGTAAMWAGTNGAIAAGTSWVAYDFGSPVQIDSFAITARTSSNSNQVWDGWNLEWSDDGTTWRIWQSYLDTASWASSERRLYDVAPGLPHVQITHEHSRNSLLGETATFDVTQTVDAALGLVIVSVSAGNSGVVQGITYDGVVAHEIANIKRGTFDILAFYALRGISGTGVKSMTFTESATQYRAVINVWTVIGAGDFVEGLSAVFNLSGSEAAFTVTPEWGGGVIGAAAWVDTSEATVITTTLDNDPADFPITENTNTFFAWASSQENADGVTPASLAVNPLNDANNSRLLAGMVALNRNELSSDIAVDRSTGYLVLGAPGEIAVKQSTAYILRGAPPSTISVRRSTTYSVVEE